MCFHRLITIFILEVKTTEMRQDYEWLAEKMRAVASALSTEVLHDDRVSDLLMTHQVYFQSTFDL